jgi:hypothetical protein
MVHFVIQWDLPRSESQLNHLRNKAKNDWLPVTLGHKGVIEVHNYRNPLGSNPHVAITIDFDSLDNWRDFIDSADYIPHHARAARLGLPQFSRQCLGPFEILS